MGSPLLHLVQHSFHSASVTLKSASARHLFTRWPNLSSCSSSCGSFPTQRPFNQLSGLKGPAHVRSGVRPYVPRSRLPVEGPGGGVVEMPLLYALRFAQAGLLQGGWELSYPLTVGGVGVELGPEPGPGLGS